MINRGNIRVFYYCHTSIHFLYNGGYYSGYQSLQALYLSGTPSQKAGSRPPSCLYLDNRLYIANGCKELLIRVLCLSGQEMAPTRQRPLLKDSWHHNNDYVGGVTC